jgi:hypothetical protein
VHGSPKFYENGRLNRGIKPRGGGTIEKLNFDGWQGTTIPDRKAG